MQCLPKLQVSEPNCALQQWIFENSAAHACAGKLRLFVSNNDMRLRVFDVPSMRLVDNIPCLAPVNYAALSPDGALLACVSDSEETRLYHAAPSGESPPNPSACSSQPCAMDT